MKKLNTSAVYLVLVLNEKEGCRRSSVAQKVDCLQSCDHVMCSINKAEVVYGDTWCRYYCPSSEKYLVMFQRNLKEIQTDIRVRIKEITLLDAETSLGY